MNLRKAILTNNACYQRGFILDPEGIMVYSTGYRNPYLARYIQPNDGHLGKNPHNNDWNRPFPGGMAKCVHAFIGMLKDGSIATYQTLPWKYKSWQRNGAFNNTHLSFEICEDDFTSAAYFNLIYQEAVDLCVYLCQRFNLDPTSNGVLVFCDRVTTWLSRFGKDVDTFCYDVKMKLTAVWDFETILALGRK
jgi:N-acetylmuramoyl-L-alanine amidase